MKPSRIIYFSLLVCLTLILSSCSASPVHVSWPGLAADQERAYVANGSIIYAVNLKDGSQAWQYPDKAETSKVYYASPVVSTDGQLLVGDYRNELYSLDPKTGALIWPNPFSLNQGKGRYVGSPLVAGETIFAPSSDNSLYMLSTSGSGDKKFTSKHSLWSAPITDGKRLYLAAMDHNLYALSLTDVSQMLWKLDVKAAVISSPALTANGFVIVGTLGNKVWAVEPGETAGIVSWQFDTENGVWGTPVIKGNIVYFADLAGNIYAVDIASGKITTDNSMTWKIKPGGAIIAGLALTPDGLIAVTESGSVLSIDFQGKSRTISSLQGKLYTTPVYSNGAILIVIKGGQDGILLTALDQDGKELWAKPFTPGK
jgi:outer membrane protein assembly factor BamB